MEKPRPSVNLGKSTAISGSAPTSSASRSGSSSGLSHTATSPRPRSAPRSARQSASGTIAGTPNGTSVSAAASRSRAQRSSTIAPSLMSRGIDALLERLDAEPPDGVDEALVLVAALDVDVDQALDDVGHLLSGEGRADDLAERRLIALCAADRDLVPLLAVLVDAEHADVADVMVSAGVHAARHVELELADVVQIVEIVEPALDC